MKKEVGKLRAPEISLRLNSYDDIFSDFDPRPYVQRPLSVDFLEEIERASRDKKIGSIELNFLIPRYKRNNNNERQIKKRLKEHFKKHFFLIKKEKTDIVKKGVIFVLAGIFLMFLATFILFKYQQSSLITSFLIILLEPGGWFLFWEGMDGILFESQKVKPNLEFYKKMHKSRIDFFSE